MKEMLKRELNKTYLVLTSEGEEYEESYELEMIVRNAPEGLLPLHILRVDAQVWLYYEISAKQSLKDHAGRNKLSGALIRSLFETVEGLLKRMQDYLLDAEHILFDLEHIYIKEKELFFCYCPWHQKDTLTAFREMLEEILGEIDYCDTDGVALAYHLYQNACKGDFEIAAVLREHAKQPEAAAEEKPQPEDLVFPDEEEWNGESAASDNFEEKAPSRKRFLGKVVRFFLKKEKQEEYDAWERKAKNDIYGSPEPLFMSQIQEEQEYTQVLEPADDNTVLLEDMPAGNWRLRPLMAGYEEFCITTDSFIIGKKKSAVDGCIRRESVSRIHSRFFVRDGRLFISDANSTNGTFVNEEPVEPGETVEIFAGDRILFADVGYECYNSL